MLPSVTSNITSKTVTWCSAKSFWWPANIDAYYKRGQHQQRWSNTGSNETKVSDLLAALHTALQMLSTFPILITRTMIRSHTVVFISDFSIENVKKTRCRNVTNEASDIIWIYVFPCKRQKNWVPTCHELGIRCHFYVWIFHENAKKGSVPKCQELSIRCHFYIDFSVNMSQKARYPHVRN